MQKLTPNQFGKMISKGYHKFSSRLKYFRDDIEMADVLCSNKEFLKGEDYLFRGVKQNTHTRLASRENAPGSRNLVIKHLRKTVYVAFLKEMYEEVTEYFKYILNHGVRNGLDASRVVGEHAFDLPAKRILQLALQGKMVDYVVDRVFRSLEEERNTIKLLRNIKNKLSLAIDENIMKAAEPYLLCRHIFVHRDGKPDADFKTKYPHISIDSKGRISLNIDFLVESYTKVDALVRQYDVEMINKQLLEKEEIK